MLRSGELEKATKNEKKVRKMKRKTLLFILFSLFAASMVLPVYAKNPLFMVIQCEITGFIDMGPDPGGNDK